MQTYQERVVIEKKDLDEKRAKLSTFIDSQTFQELAEREQSLLKRQLEVMVAYSNVLAERIDRFETISKSSFQ